MDWKSLALVFGTVFVAELGDKTQLATMLFASDRATSKWTVFAGSSLALVASSALGVLGGAILSNYISERTLQIVAGVGFLVIGGWTLWRAFGNGGG